jgi:hypothetical protein
LAIDPNATGPAVLLFEAGNTVVRAFIEAGVFALAAIAFLLWITLRRITDVLLTLVPLLVAVVVTFVHANYKCQCFPQFKNVSAPGSGGGRARGFRAAPPGFTAKLLHG